VNSRTGSSGPPDLGPPTTLILIRHGHTDDTGHVLAGGDGAGASLNAMGVDVAERLAKVLADLPAEPGPDVLGRPEVVITSPAARAQQTARLIAAGLGLPAVVDDDWNEVLAGDWQGRSIADIIQNWPDEYRAWSQATDVRPPGGESFDRLAQRAALGADRVVQAHRGQTVVIVSHAGPIRALIGGALRADPIAARRLRIDPGSVSVLRRWADGGCEISAVNSGV
jgi:ribonuclease H / adenosylcobalamin/alpha-ribazole phosphatase